MKFKEISLKRELKNDENFLDLDAEKKKKIINHDLQETLESKLLNTT